LPNSPTDTLPDLPECLPRGLPEAPERLSRIACDLTDGPAGTKRLACGIRQSTNGLGCRPTRAQGLLAQLSDVANRIVECLNEPLENFWVPIEGRQRAIENVVEVLQPHFQPRLGLHTLDVHLDFAHADVYARDHLEKVRELRPEREMRLQALDINVDLLDFALADIDKNIRVGTRFAALEMLATELVRAPRSRGRLFAAASVSVTCLVGTRHDLSSRQSATGSGFSGVGFTTGTGLTASLTSAPARRLLRCLANTTQQIVWQFGGSLLGLIHSALGLTGEGTARG
jgi:hypothetical protein